MNDRYRALRELESETTLTYPEYVELEQLRSAYLADEMSRVPFDLKNYGTKYQTETRRSDRVVSIIVMAAFFVFAAWAMWVAGGRLGDVGCWGMNETLERFLHCFLVRYRTERGGQSHPSAMEPVC